jgi:Flp pilus assembly protein TadD
MALTKKQKLDELLQGAIDAYQAGRIAEAVDRLVRTSGDFPKAPRLWGYLGFLYGEVGNDPGAVHAFRKCVALSPRSEQASLGLFHSLWRSGKTDAAFDEMRRFVKSNNSPQYRRLIREMLAETPEEQASEAPTLVVA